MSQIVHGFYCINYFLLSNEMFLDPGRLQLRWSRLKKEYKVQTERERVRIEMLRKFKDRRFCAVQGQVQDTLGILFQTVVPRLPPEQLFSTGVPLIIY